MKIVPTDFMNERQWKEFKSCIKTHFVNALNPDYQKVVKVFAENEIVLEDYNVEMENDIENLIDLAKEVN